MILPPLGPLTLGTAQFGSRYGIVNETGCPSDEALCEILGAAAAEAIDWLDTARAYGDAERRLAAISAPDRFAIITKILPMNGSRPVPEAIAASIAASLAALETDRLDIVLFHRAEDALRAGAVSALEEQVARGRICEIGASVYSPEEGIACLAEPTLRHLQIPFNPLDRRWDSEAFHRAVADRPDVSIHARSAFLQGLLLNEPDRWPDWVDEAEAIGAELDQAVRLSGSKGRLDLCLRYHRSMSWIRTSVIGVDSASQLRAITAASAEAEPLDSTILERLHGLGPLVPERLLDPSKW